VSGYAKVVTVEPDDENDATKGGVLRIRSAARGAIQAAILMNREQLVYLAKDILREYGSRTPMSELTDAVRRQLIAEGQPRKELAAVLAAGGKTWTADEMTEEFEVLGFSAPFVGAKCRATGVMGSLQFAVSPPEWKCSDCSWLWPLPGNPTAGAECDNCGGELENTGSNRLYFGWEE
jgi:hypothetical protein